MPLSCESQESTVCIINQIKTSSTVACTFLYLQRCKSWIQVDRVFLVVVFLLKLYHARKPVHISAVLWFNRKIASILRAKSIPTGFVVVVYLQRKKCNQLLSDKSILRQKKETVWLMLRIEMIPTSKERTDQWLLLFFAVHTDVEYGTFYGAIDLRAERKYLLEY